MPSRCSRRSPSTAPRRWPGFRSCGRRSSRWRGVTEQADGMEQIGNLWGRWAALSLRRSWLLVLVGAALFAVCVPFAARLYGDLHTDLRELLPQGAPAAVALQELEKRIGGLSHPAGGGPTPHPQARHPLRPGPAEKPQERPPAL